MPKIFVINLISSHERREKIEKRLNELGCEFAFFEAIDGREKKHPLFEHYDDDLRKKYRRRELSGGELGIWASHYSLWQQCVNLNEPIIVMEDDIEVKDNFLSAVEVAKGVVEKLQYVRLAGIRKRRHEKIDSFGGFQLVRYLYGPTGAFCYMLTPLAAKKFLAFAEHWYIAVDDYMDRYWIHGIECCALYPYPIGASYQPSTISRLSKKPVFAITKFKYEILKIVEFFARCRHYFFVAKSSKIRMGK